MINVKVTEVMAFDKNNENTLFTLKQIDDHAALLEMDCKVTSENIDQLTAALRRAFALLEFDQ
jgi:hypothetical protein